jgi:pimeloyl-ACP methyl ester carboxylesterase
MAHHAGPEGYVRQLRAQLGRTDSWSSLAAIACPTLVLGGRQDTMCSPALHQAMAASIPNARLAIIEDCGHLSTLEQPEAVTALLRTWLEEISIVARRTEVHT